MRGLIEQADGGTLFLDQIDDMPLNMQRQGIRSPKDGEFLEPANDRRRSGAPDQHG